MDRKFTGVSARGNSIVIDFIYQSHRCRETLKVRPTKTALKEASRKRDAILYAIAFGNFEYALYFPSSKNSLKFSKNKSALITIKLALENWLRQASKRCQPSTIRDYNSAVHYHLIPSFGHLTLEKFNVSDVYNWLDTINISNKRINNVLSPLRQALQDAFYDGVIDKNPMDRFKSLSPETREPKPFNKDEISKILNQLFGQEKNLIQFAFYSGLRTSELIGLRWEDVDLDKGLIHIRTAIVRKHEKSTKTASGQRTIELLSASLEALKSQVSFTAKSIRVFNDPNTNLPWSGDHIIRKRVWIPTLLKARVQYRNPYQTRHTFASMLLINGKNPMWVAQQMGHKDWGMIRKVYGRWITEE